MPKLTWDHIHLRTKDVEGMASWLEKMLGGEVIRTTQQGAARIDVKCRSPPWEGDSYGNAAVRSRNGRKAHLN